MRFILWGAGGALIIVMEKDNICKKLDNTLLR